MNTLDKSKLASVFFGGFLCGVTYLISCGKVNTNEASANPDSTSSALYVKANGTDVGEFISLTNALEQSSTGQSDKVIVASSSTGFLIPVRRDGAIDQGRIYFSGIDCTGTSYVRYAVPKSVFRNGSDIWYVASSTTETSVTYASSKDRNTGACTNSSSTEDPVVEVAANNPAVTGVSVNSYTAPITIE